MQLQAISISDTHLGVRRFDHPSPGALNETRQWMVLFLLQDDDILISIWHMEQAAYNMKPVDCILKDRAVFHKNLRKVLKIYPNSSGLYPLGHGLYNIKRFYDFTTG